jgi:hypothetical protein
MKTYRNPKFLIDDLELLKDAQLEILSESQRNELKQLGAKFTENSTSYRVEDLDIFKYMEDLKQRVDTDPFRNMPNFTRMFTQAGEEDEFGEN